MSSSLLTLLLATITLVNGSTYDGTLQHGATGTDVVWATVNKIDDTCIFDDDKLLLRRIAHVETTDGSDVYELDSGGMWQVTSSGLNETKDSGLSTFHDEIWDHFDITWSNVIHDDMNIPLHSALAARLRIEHQTGFDIPRSVEDQADYWADDYNEGDVDRQTFIDKVESLNDGCSIPQADMVFVLDGSGSIDAVDFQLTLQFVENIIDCLVAEDHSNFYVRVGVIQYATSVQIELELDQHDKQFAIETVRNIRQMGGGTYSHLALEEMKALFLDNEREDGAVPMIGIFFTDGQSVNFDLTVAAAQDIHDTTSIEMFALGIGPSVFEPELEAIASDPICTHFFLLEDFDSMKHFEVQLLRATCNSHTELEEGEDSSGEIPPNESVYFRLTVIAEHGGVTLHVKTEVGRADIYASYTARNPSSVNYDYRESVHSSMVDGIDMGIPYVPDDQLDEEEERPLYVTLSTMENDGYGVNSEYTISYTNGYYPSTTPTVIDH